MTFHLFQFCNVIAKKQLKGRGDTPLPNPPWLFGGGGTPPFQTPRGFLVGFLEIILCGFFWWVFFRDNIMWLFAR